MPNALREWCPQGARNFRANELREDSVVVLTRYAINVTDTEAVHDLRIDVFLEGRSASPKCFIKQSRLVYFGVSSARKIRRQSGSPSSPRSPFR